MNERIKELRKFLGLTQRAFGDKIGVKGNTIAQYEIGRNEPIDAVITLICREFGVDEIWLRTGAGEMFRRRSRGEELEDYLSSVLNDRPESFRSALITALLRYDPDGPEWEVLERIFRDVSAQYEKETGEA